MSAIFVFGSNLAGIHGAGVAKTAVRFHGAQMFIGMGRTGNAYAIPTKDENIRTLPLDRIKPFVDDFCAYARNNLSDLFYVTRIGCGLAGYRDSQIGPMFKSAPGNCMLPIEWTPYLDDVPFKRKFHTWEDQHTTTCSGSYSPNH